jgi:hypothetical protein
MRTKGPDEGFTISKMRFRHSGPLADWMKTVVEMEQTKLGIMDELAFVYSEQIDPRDIKVEPYTYARHGWTHVVTWKGRVVGFTDRAILIVGGLEGPHRP